jgi:hypothetical protein
MPTNDAASLPSRPMVLLHSTKQLDIVGDGITLTYDPSPEQNYHYRYLGLRQLLHTRTRYFSVPAHWSRGSSAVFRIQDNDTVRTTSSTLRACLTWILTKVRARSWRDGRVVTTAGA